MQHNMQDDYEQEMDLDEQARLYEDDLYENYTFGERLDNGYMDDSELEGGEGLDDAAEEDTITEPISDSAESGPQDSSFGESIDAIRDAETGHVAQEHPADKFDDEDLSGKRDVRNEE
jgi:hypothetical protein